jgi:amino acid adenylation domain-containing protein
LAANEQHAQVLSFRLSPQQERLWSPGPDGPLPCVQAAVQVPAGVGPADVRAALRRVVQRHEILRTTFPRRAGMRVPSQRVNDDLEPLWVGERWSRSGHPSDSVDELLAEEVRQELDLERGPVVRARLLSADDSGHLLLLTIPLACADATSLAVIVFELASLLGLTDAELSGEPLQYADYAAWRSELQASGETAPEASAFWAEREPAPSPVLLFGRRGAPRSGLVGRLPVPLAADLLAGGANEFRTSEAVFLEACWHACVARTSGEREVVLATVVAGRAHEEIRHAVGPYAQALPIRTRIEDETSLAELVDRVRRERQLAERWLEHASRELLEAVADRCVIGFTSVDADRPTGLRIDVTVGSPARFDLELWLAEGAAELRYEPNAYDVEDAAQIARQLAALVAAAVAAPDAAVADLELTAPDERDRLVAAFRTPLSEPGGARVHELFDEQVERVPDAVAVVAEGGSLTYRELGERANRLAHHLRTLGVGPNVAVGLCMDRSTTMIEALLGILEAGGAYVPLNFEHPGPRLAHQLAETEAPVLLTQEALLDRLPPYGGAVVCMDRDRAAIDASPGTSPERDGGADDLAYVMYTSGSTGLPKGVKVTHRNLAGYVAAVSRALELGSDGERLGFAAVSAISTDLGNTSVFASLLSGGTLHLVAPDVSMDGALFASYLSATQVDVLKITPSQLRALVAGSNAAAVLPRRCLVIGGEELRWELVDNLLESGAGCRIFNHYGPTETTVGASVFEVVAGRARQSATVPIGRALANSRTYVVDQRLRPLPPGVPGELCIGGDGVADGYVGQPEQTAEAFRADPFAEAGGRMYRTGDRARLLRDGSVEFLGRIDDQVKIRGFRVEPGEIEAVLRRHPAVPEAAVALQRPDGAEPVLIGYVVAPTQPSTEELQAFLREALPAYMVPTKVVRLDALPLTPSGKVDRSALPEPGQAARETEYVAPRTPLELSLARIWEELLGVEQVGVFDDFFTLGGHSLLATQVVIRIRREHADIPLHAIFDSPTVAGLAEVVAEAEEESTAVEPA